jgi:hypothetical protein
MTAMGRKGTTFSGSKLSFRIRPQEEGRGGGVYQSQTFASQFRHAANGPSGRAHMLTVHS